MNKKIKIAFIFLFGFVFAVIIAGIICLFGELQLKQDVVNTSGNIGKIYIRLEKYKEEHGRYPAQQDMSSLLKTLGMNRSDFFKVSLFDIESAAYHAPTQDSEAPVITMRVKLHVFEKSKMLVRDHDGWHYEDIADSR